MNYKDLIVWQKSRTLVKDIYILTEKFPKNERFALIDQLHRAAISIPSNIAEGFQRQTLREYVQFLYHSYGSCAEVETQLLLATDLNYLSETEVKKVLSLLLEVQKMLNVIITKSKNKLKTEV